MHYRVFLDTNIYIAEGYSFRGSKLSRIKELVNQRAVTLVTSDIVEHEVRAHMEKDLKKSVPALAKAYGNFSLALFKTNGYLNITRAIDTDDWITACKQEYSLYLGECYARNIRTSKLDGVAIKKAYLTEQAPFTSEKPDEFKDAFILSELTYDIIKCVEAGEVCYCVVSNDAGFRDGLIRMLSETATTDVIEAVKVYESLSDFCHDMTIAEKQGAFLKACLSTEANRKGLRKYISEFMEVADYNLTGDDYYDSIIPEEIELLNVSDLSITEDIIDVGTPGTKCANVDINVSAVVKVRYSWIDEQRSFWDMDGDFHPHYCEETASYQVQFVLPKIYNYENCIVPDDWQPGDDFDLSGIMINITSASSEYPRIELSQDNKL